jgi:hypothetical protein
MQQRLSMSLKPGSPFWHDIIRKAHKELMRIREETQPEAGGIVFAVDTNHANAIAAFMRKELGVNPSVVHTGTDGHAAGIETFSESTAPWIVTVKMVNEGVDIPRLRVGVYLSNVTSRKACMQAWSRIIRKQGHLEHFQQMAHLFMPADPRLQEWALEFAKEVEAVLGDAPEGEAMEREPREDYEPPLYVIDDADSYEDGIIIDGEFLSEVEIVDTAQSMRDELTGHGAKLTRAFQKFAGLSDAELAMFGRDVARALKKKQEN